MDTRRDFAGRLNHRTRLRSTGSVSAMILRFSPLLSIASITWGGFALHDFGVLPLRKRKCRDRDSDGGLSTSNRWDERPFDPGIIISVRFDPQNLPIRTSDQRDDRCCRQMYICRIVNPCTRQLISGETIDFLPHAATGYPSFRATSGSRF